MRNKLKFNKEYILQLEKAKKDKYKEQKKNISN